MTQEEKQLLLQDLCARLPYGVIVKLDDKFKFNKGDRVLVKELLDLYCIEGIKPYLRPMSSMTDEEMEEFESLGWRIDELADNEPWAHCGDIYHITDGIDWLSKNHFDFRGLIEKGLAIAVTKENNPYKTELA